MNNEIIIIVYKLFYCKLFYYYLYIKNRKKFNLIFKINFIYNRGGAERDKVIPKPASNLFQV